MAIKGVLFDFSGTLFCVESVRDWLQAVLEETGPTANRGLAGAEDIPCEADARAVVDRVGLIEAARIAVDAADGRAIGA